MSNFDNVWNSAGAWREVDQSRAYGSAILPIFAWIGMIGFAFFGILTAAFRTDLATVLMLASMVLWLVAGVAYIRLQRTNSKTITVIDQ